MRYRAFCIGYEPPGRTLTKAVIDTLMQEADVCIMARKGVPIGSKFDGFDGRRLRCVAHEHHGKIVVLEDDTL